MGYHSEGRGPDKAIGGRLRTSLTNRYVVKLIKLVDQWADNGHVNSHIRELGQTQVILDDADNITSDAMDVSVDRQMGVRVGPAAVEGIACPLGTLDAI